MSDLLCILFWFNNSVVYTVLVKAQYVILPDYFNWRFCLSAITGLLYSEHYSSFLQSQCTSNGNRNLPTPRLIWYCNYNVLQLKKIGFYENKYVHRLIIKARLFSSSQITTVFQDAKICINSFHYTVFYNIDMVNLVQNTHNRHHIACLWGQDMGYHLWV